MAGYIVHQPALAGHDSASHPPANAAPFGAILDAAVLAGPRTAIRPAKSVVTSAGYLLPGWGQDYLDRITIKVDNANFGTVAGPVQRTLTVINRYAVAKSVSAQGAVGLAGITIVGFPALPFDLLPTQERSWTLEAAPAGDPVIAGYLTFTIGGDALRTVDLSGIRAIIIPHLADWAAPPELERGYDDAIGASISLAESRESRGDDARVRVRYNIVALDPAEASALALTLQRTRALPVGVPLWSEFLRTTGAAAAGASSVPLETTTERAFSTTHPFVLLWIAWDAWAIVQVSAVAANTLTLTAPLLADWPAGTLVAPVRFGKLAVGAPQQLPNDRLRRFRVDFQEVPV